MSDIEDLEKEKNIRMAIINPDKCKPEKCGHQCLNSCPINRRGKLCITIDNSARAGKGLAVISEPMCIGCNICTKACPFDAIKIVKVAGGLGKDIVHRYSKNTFVLHKFPDLRRGNVTGILGQNGLGKSTILSILAGHFHMNLGQFNIKYDELESEIRRRFRGTNTLSILQGQIAVAWKQQTLEQYKSLPHTVESFLPFEDLRKEFSLDKLKDRELKDISGGELQRCVIAHICVAGLLGISEKPNLYLFDEPTNYLDLKQRIQMVDLIKKYCVRHDSFVVVVDHDLSILDYISDQLVCLYGERAVYGVCSLPMPVGNGINAYMDGYLPKENVRFRPDPYRFQRNHLDMSELVREEGQVVFQYPVMEWTIGTFTLKVEASEYRSYGINVLLGENGGGKTTFINLLSTMIQNQDDEKSARTISLKEQYIGRAAQDHLNTTVDDFIGSSFYRADAQIEIIRPLGLDKVVKRKLKKLSGGELQKVMIARCLLRTADIYFLDEPSAFLDVETRMVVAKVIRKYFAEKSVLVFLVDHDILMINYLADKVLLFEGEPSVSMRVVGPLSVEEGMNRYLKNLGITLRQDPVNFRGRINKADSGKDREQKKKGQYYMNTF